jgi:SPP1 family predicted phage head-tail adaptor
MKIGKLRHRIIFLKPLRSSTNSMGETVPVWIPFKPTINHNMQTDDGKVYLTHDNAGNAVLVYHDGKPYAHTLALTEFAVWANVMPMTGREYEESQKIRAETTYRITTRYFPHITTDMKILYKSKTFDIVSVLNIEERNTQLQLVCWEVDENGKG